MEKVFDYVIACTNLKGKISDMKVIEDFESRPHKAVAFVVERGKERQEWNEQQLPKALPGFSGGRLRQEGAQKRKAEKKERKTREAKQETSETRSLKV